MKEDARKNLRHFASHLGTSTGSTKRSSRMADEKPHKALGPSSSHISICDLNEAFGSTMSMTSDASHPDHTGDFAVTEARAAGRPCMVPFDGLSQLGSDTSDDSYGPLEAAGQCLGMLGRRACTKKQLYRRLPILEWAPKYELDWLISDMIAGITVGLTVIPQGIAYAIVAGLPPQYGLYSAFMGCFLYCIFGSVKEVTVGPTAIMSLMTAEKARLSPDFAVLLSFLTGVIVFLFGALQLGFVIEFISIPVIAGFTSAAAITIASGQVKHIFGLSITERNHITGITGTWVEIGENFPSLRWQDTVLGLSCCAVLLLMRELKGVSWFKTPSKDADETTSCQSLWSSKPAVLRKIFSKTVWLTSTARNAIIVFGGLIIAYICDPGVPWGDSSYETTFKLTGNISAGIPAWEMPPFETEYGDHKYDFMAMIHELGSALFVIPMVAILESVAIAKAFSGGKPVDSNQEMIALGLSNLLGSFVSGYPITGSFGRTAVNANSGVKSTFGGVFTGVLVLITLAVLMPACAYIPKATLAAVIITAVIFMVEHHVVKPMWKASRTDLVVGFIAFFVCLFWELEMGIIVGAIVQVVIVLKNTARPTVKITSMTAHGPGTEYLYVSTDRAILYPSISFVRNVINKAGMRRGHSRMPVVIDCFYIYMSDFTSYKGFQAMADDFHSRSQPLVFINLRRNVEKTLCGAGAGHLNIVHSEEELKERLIELRHEYLEHGATPLSRSTTQPSTPEVPKSKPIA